LRGVLKSKPNNKPELKSVRESIGSSFEKIECCLMPYPGKDVARKSDYDGRLSLIDDDFRKELFMIISKILHSDGLITKKINGTAVTCADLKSYIEAYHTAFQSAEIPETATIYELTVDRYMTLLIEQSVDKYKEIFFGNADIVTRQSIEIVHNNGLTAALETFDNKTKMGNSEHADKSRRKLKSLIEATYKEWSTNTQKSFEAIQKAKETADAAVAEKKVLEDQMKADAEETKKKIDKLHDDLENGRIKQKEFLAHQERMEGLLEKQNQKYDALLAENADKEKRRRDLEKHLKDKNVPVSGRTLKDGAK